MDLAVLANTCHAAPHRTQHGAVRCAWRRVRGGRVTPRHVTEAGLGRGSTGRPTTSLHDARLGATTQSSLHPGGEVQLFGVQKLETAGLMLG